MDPGRRHPGSDKYGAPNTTVDGNPASFDDFYGDALLVWEPRGITVWLGDVPDPVAAYADVAIVEDPFDPAGWVASGDPQGRRGRPSWSTGRPARITMPSMNAHSMPMPRKLSSSWATPIPVWPV